MSSNAAIAVPWIEKYRPRTMADVVGNPEAISRLQVIAKEGNLPNLLLCGPPGTGKTTSMLCLARDLLAPVDAGVSDEVAREILKNAVLELNASDDRGLDVVREKIKLFAQTRKTLPHRVNSSATAVLHHRESNTDVGDDAPAAVQLHKIVILDEADSMTPAAQQALRRTMEMHSATTRFAFACNNSNKIIEPIQSRCAVVRFSKLSNVDTLKRMLHIIQAENVAYTDDGLEAILYLAEGDLRQATNALQATYTGYGMVNADNVFKVCDQPHPVLVENIMVACLAKRDLAEAHAEMNRLLGRGYAPADVIATFFKVAQTNVRLFRSEMQQLEILKIVSDTTMRIAEGVGSPLQLAAMLARIITATINATNSATV